MFIMPCLVCNYVQRSVPQFYVYFYAFIPHVISYLFPCLAFSSSCAILSQADLLEVPTAYLGSYGYFLARGLLLLNGGSLERLMLMRGGGCLECATCLAWFCTLSICTLPP
jgi:hypothetical protein